VLSGQQVRVRGCLTVVVPSILPLLLCREYWNADKHGDSHKSTTPKTYNHKYTTHKYTSSKKPASGAQPAPALNLAADFRQRTCLSAAHMQQREASQQRARLLILVLCVAVLRLQGTRLRPVPLLLRRLRPLRWLSLRQRAPVSTTPQRSLRPWVRRRPASSHLMEMVTTRGRPRNPTSQVRRTQRLLKKSSHVSTQICSITRTHIPCLLLVQILDSPPAAAHNLLVYCVGLCAAEVYCHNPYTRKDYN
jgi:hypothetical protein